MPWGFRWGWTDLFDPTREIDKPMLDEDHAKRSDSDRRLRQAARFARVLRVLELIQSRGRYDINGLARELECSERTIFRDLNVLELAGVPWGFMMRRGTSRYQVRTTDFRFPVINLTDDEMGGPGPRQSQSLPPLASMLTQGPARPRESYRLLRRDDQAVRLLDDLRRLTSVLDLKMADHSKHHEVIRTVQWSMIEGKQLAGKYATPYESKPKRLILDPHPMFGVSEPSPRARPLHSVLFSRGFVDRRSPIFGSL